MQAKATVSPDGGSVAYTRMTGTEIWVADGNGRNSRLLASRVAGQRVVAVLWSPKGNRILLERVAEADRETTGSPQSASFECVDAATGKALSQERMFRFDFGVLLNDGRFVFAAAGNPGGVRFMIVKTDPDTGKFLSSPEPTTNLPQWTGISDAVESLSASANGELIGAVVARRTIDTYWADLRLPGPTLSGETRLTGELGTNYPHAWTPDGDGIIFDGNDGGNLIGMQRLGQPKMQVLTRMPNTPAMANFSPDGKLILFAKCTGWPGHVVAIFSMPAGGGVPRQLPTSGAIDEFHCSVSFIGSCVLRETVENREFVFYALDPVLGQGRELARASWKPTVIGDWTLSPDGFTVAMASHDPDHPAILLIPVVADGSRPIETIPVNRYGVVRTSTWAADGKGFYVQTKNAYGYSLLYMDRVGHAILLRQSTNSIWGIPSRDGKRLAFPSPTVRRNVWIGHSSLGTD